MANRAVSFGLGLSQLAPLQENVRLAALAERAGFQRVYCPDNLMMKPVWPILTLVAEHTRRVQVGPAVTHPFLTHPALIAGYIALLDEVSNRRAFLGIGRGAFYEFLGMAPEKQITAVRESIEIVNRLLSGDRSPYYGKVFTCTAEATLRWKPVRKRVPISIGSWGGPKMCQIAGEIADEVDMGFLLNPAQVPFIKEHIATGAGAAGKDPGRVGVGFGSICSISARRKAAHDLARRYLAMLLHHIVGLPGAFPVDAEEVAAVEKHARLGDFREAARYVSDDTIKKFCLAGTPEDVLPQLDELIAAGVTQVGMGSPLGPDRGEAVSLIGKMIIPRYRGARKMRLGRRTVK